MICFTRTSSSSTSVAPPNSARRAEPSSPFGQKLVEATCVGIVRLCGVELVCPDATQLVPPKPRDLGPQTPGF